MAIQLPVEPSSFLLLGACMFVAGFTSGSITFGVSIMFHLLWTISTIVFGLEGAAFKDTVGLLSFQHLFVFVPLAIFTRRKGSLVLFFSMFPANTCGMFIGVALLLVLPPKPVKLVLAIAVLITALWRWGVNFTIYIKQRRKRRNQTEAVNDASGAAGVSSGGGGVKASGGAEEQRGVEMSLAPSHTAASTSSTDSDHSDNDCQHTNATAMTAVPCEAPTAETGSSVPPKAAAAAGAAGSGAAAPTCKERVVAEFLRNRPSCVVGVGGAIAGFIAGILGGLIAAGGPPLMIFVTVAQLDKALIMATISWMAVPTTVVNVCVLFSAGVISIEDWYFHLVATICCGSGVAVGLQVHKRLSNKTIRGLILALLSMAGCLLLSRGSMAVFGIAVASLLVTVVCLWGVLNLLDSWWAKRHPAPKQRPGVASAGGLGKGVNPV